MYTVNIPKSTRMALSLCYSKLPLLPNSQHRTVASAPTFENTTAWPPSPPQGYSCVTSPREPKGLILGIYSPCIDEGLVSASNEDEIVLTATADRYNRMVCNKLIEQYLASGPTLKLGQSRLFFGIDPAFPIVALVGLGEPCYGYNAVEKRDESKEAIRLAVGAGARAMQNLSVHKLYVESFGHTESSAEGSALALWIYQDLKNSNNRITIPYLGLYNDCDWASWQIGLEKAAAQNLARQLMETPSNLMTPMSFAIATVEALSKHGVNIEIKVREWARDNHMNGFLAVASGSIEPPIFLEIIYNGCDVCLPPVVLVGKGITFDSGGIDLIRDEGLLDIMRGDMGGAASVVATIRAAARLKLPINLRGLIPLCENMPGASAAKPGDIIKAVNGKTVLIQSTDYEGPIILADTMSYAQKYKPQFILDVGALTRQTADLLAAAATVVFTNDDHLWTSMKAASIHTGDRVYRLPLWEAYLTQLEPPHLSVDIVNVPNPPASAYTCTIAAFLQQFVCHYKWIHMDTFNVMVERGETTYLREGMSGRPTRTMIEFLAQMACKPVDC